MRPDSSAPQRVGDYRLLTLLGEGGMGIVHLAQGPDGRRVALKVLRPQIVGDREARGRLEREVGSLQRIRSPWVAEMLDADPWAEVPYVVTRYVPGPSLHEHVAAEGPVVGGDLLWIAGCLAEGLSAVHAAGVLHRDVKPGNVLMEGRTPILIDFGLARVAEDARLTQTGWLLGTPGYLAAEVLYGDDATAAADVHAWAATVAYAATGRNPYGKGPAMAVMDRSRRGQHDLSGIEQPLRDVLAAALSPDPLDRPSLVELLAWLRPQSTRPELAPAPPPGVLFSGGDATMPLALAGQARDGRDAVDAEPRTLADAVTPVLPPTTTAFPATTPLSAAPTAAPPPPPPFAPAGGEPPIPVVTPVGPGGALPDPGALARMERRWDEQHGLAPLDGEGIDAAGPAGEEHLGTLPPAPLGERLRRLVLVGLGAVVVGVALAAAPWLTLGVVLVTVWLLRAGSLASSAVAARRSARGAKWHDGLRWLVSSPWHLVRAVPGALLLVGWSVGLAAAGLLLCYAGDLAVESSLTVAGAALGVGLWSGPAAPRLRSPVARVLVPAARTPLPWLGACALLLGAVLGIGLLIASQGVSWAPFSSGPFGL
ncbi:protein kinase [Nocardioides sp.]|uniref:serine/threonine-protein kinase n=1 Tax=Nocardioides sp. TaxID=35761 RepID=UPI00351498B9